MDGILILSLAMTLLEVPMIGRWIIIIFIYIFVFFLCIMVVGVTGQHLKLNRRMRDNRQMTLFILIVALTMYIGLVLLILNPYAQDYLRI